MTLLDHLPVLVVLLTYVAQTQSVFVGFILLFTFAIGMGLLFILIGLVVLLGTSAPLISRLWGEPAQVGPEFYNAMGFWIAVVFALFAFKVGRFDLMGLLKDDAVGDLDVHTLGNRDGLLSYSRHRALPTRSRTGSRRRPAGRAPARR